MSIASLHAHSSKFDWWCYKGRKKHRVQQLIQNLILVLDSYPMMIGLVCAGMTVALYMRKQNRKDFDLNSPFQGYLSGWAAAIMLIVFGLVGVFIKIFGATH